MQSLETLLQILANTPEEDKRALIRSSITLLREVCNNINNHSQYSKFKKLAYEAKNILDKILIGNLESEDEEEFLESSEKIKDDNIKEEAKKLYVPYEEHIDITQKEPLVKNVLPNFYKAVEKWNQEIEPWFNIILPKYYKGLETIKEILKNISSLRSNLVSATLNSASRRENVKKFEIFWKEWIKDISKHGYEVYPPKFGKLTSIYGNTIFSCRAKVKEKEIALILPGLKKDNKIIQESLSLVTLSPLEDFPNGHPDKDLPPHWRGILGELELLLKHLEIQHSVSCGIEAINKGNIEPLNQCYDRIVNEIKRRGDALRNALKRKESIYRIATNYWRVEECFWGIFHDDGRPPGHSFFDRLRKRVQAWRPFIRKAHKIYVKDFNPVSDTLASINKYIGNIILENKEGIPPGTILREIRPAIIVKVNNVTRLLKGRIIAT